VYVVNAESGAGSTRGIVSREPRIWKCALALTLQSPGRQEHSGRLRALSAYAVGFGLLSISSCSPIPPEEMLTVSVILESVVYPVAKPSQNTTCALIKLTDAKAHELMLAGSSCRYCWQSRPWSATCSRSSGTVEYDGQSRSKRYFERFGHAERGRL